MSGIEVVGLVLGALPLFISAAENTRGTIRVINLARHMPERLDRFAEDLRFQDFILRQLLERLLEDTKDYANTSLDTIDWTDDILAHQLEQLLGGSYIHFKIVLQRSMRLFQSQIEKYYPQKYKVANEVPSLQQIIDDAKANGKTGHSLWERIKFVWREEERNEVLTEINECKEKLFQIWTLMGIGLAPNPRPAASANASPDDIYSIRHDAQRLHQTLLDHSPCSCSPPHQARLRLKRSLHKEVLSSDKTFDAFLFHTPNCACSVRFCVPYGGDKSQVRFTVPHTEITPGSSDESALLAIKDLCGIMCSNPVLEHGIYLHLTSEQLLQRKDPWLEAKLRNIETPRTITLQDFLKVFPKCGHWLRQQKAMLAPILAYATLQLYGSEWLGEHWTKRSITFVRDAGAKFTGKKRFDLHDPCISSILDPNADDEDDDDSDDSSTEDANDSNETDPIARRIARSKHPVKSVLALGIVLLELFLGASIESFSNATPDRDIKTIAYDVWDEHADAFDTDEVYSAIGWCLTLSPPAPLRKRGFDFPTFRAHYCKQVIDPLDAYLAGFDLTQAELAMI